MAEKQSPPPPYQQAPIDPPQFPPPQFAAPQFAPQQFAPPQLAPQQIVVMSQVPLGPRSTVITCPSCHKQCTTDVKYTNGTKTHLFALILFITTLLCCIPYCMDSCKNAEHYCSSCGAYMGTYTN